MTKKGTDKRSIKVLHVDDRDQLPRVKAHLAKADPYIDVESTSSQEDFLNMIKGGSYDCIVAGYRAKGIDGIKLAARAKKLTDHPFLLFIGRGTEEAASRAFEAGVDDYVNEGTDEAHYEVLARRIRRAVEKHLAEEALDESEEKSRALVESLTDGVIVLDDRGSVTYASETLLDLLEIERREASTGALLSIIEREYSPLAPLILEGCKGIRIERHDVEVTKRDGKVLYLRISASPMRDENREHHETLFTFTDLTDIEDFRKALARRDEEKQTILNAFQDPVCMIDKNFHYLWANKALEDVLATPKEDLEGKPCYEVWRGRDSVCDTCIVKQAFETGQTASGTMVRHDGQIWSALGIPLLDDSGKPFAAVEALRNITENSVSEIKISALHMHALEMTETKNIYEIIDKTFFALRQVFEIKKASFHLVQGDKLMAVGSTDLDFQQGYTQISERTIYRKAIDTGNIQFVTSRSQGSGDESTLLSGSKSALLLLPVRVSGEIAAILELEIKTPLFSGVDRQLALSTAIYKAQSSDSPRFADIDEQFLETIGAQVASGLERIQREQSLERIIEEKTAELKAKDRLAAIGETTTMIGHDLRNPLQNIINTLYIAEKKIGRASQEQRDLVTETGIIQDISDIKSCITYMNKIVSDLQDYARPVIAEKYSTNVVSLVKECLSDIKVPENIVVNVSAEEENPIVELDPILIKRAFINLITNAVQAMPGGGTLDIKMKDVDGEFTVEFSDTGPGIPAELRDKLFRPLETTKAKGMGMGLPVIKRFIEAHDGSITLTSPPDKGATFLVKLPRKKR